MGPAEPAGVTPKRGALLVQACLSNKQRKEQVFRDPVAAPHSNRALAVFRLRSGAACLARRDQAGQSCAFAARAVGIVDNLQRAGKPTKPSGKKWKNRLKQP